MAELQSIQSVPAGLLELLGMKGSGANPRTLDSVIQGTIDLRQAYALSRYSSPAAGFTAVAPGGAETLTVPQGQWWILLHMVGTVIAQDATTILFYCALEMAEGSTGQISVRNEQLGWNNGSAMALGHEWSIPFFPPYPFLLGPGSRLSFRYLRNRGTTVNPTVGIQANIGILS